MQHPPPPPRHPKDILHGKIDLWIFPKAKVEQDLSYCGLRLIDSHEENIIYNRIMVKEVSSGNLPQH